MPQKFSDLLRSALPLNRKQKEALDDISRHLPKEDIKELKHLIKQKKVSLVDAKLATSPQLIKSSGFYVINPDTTDKTISDYANKLNDIILKKIKGRHIEKFPKKAPELIPRYIGMNIHGFDIIKKAIALQLFASEPVHILLLGDPGTGKTDLLRSAAALHPISSFGLGSGTSGAGLTITVRGNEVSPGLLPKADKGICAIDELNLMEQKDRAALYNAMEKGFVTYDKGGKHYKFDAKVRVLATANPKGDKFVGWTVETLKQQLPFDPALLSRFHLVFLIRKPDTEQFMQITKKILKQNKRTLRKPTKDEGFIQDYVAEAEKIDVELPKRFEEDITKFVREIKENEDKYLVEVSPRLVIGFIRLAKASARMNMRATVKQEDIDLVKEIINHGLKIK